MKLTIASLLVLAGCAGNPLVGTWDGPSTTTLGTTFHSEVALNGDGTLTYSLVGAGSCNGSLVYTGYSWASDAVTMTFSGTPSCSGAITCGSVSFGCAQNQQSTLGACTYVLSSDANTLTTTNCTNGSLNTTWTRK
jgi:hypothetical protein